MKKVILVDGNNLMFRSYFATAYSGNLMKNSKGEATNALYGFVNMINKIIAEEKPEYMAVAFDIGKNFRHEKYPNYKAGRSETPTDLLEQMPKARNLLDAMGIRHYEVLNYEADDIIGTLSKMALTDPEFDATIISSDKDLLQLINKEVDVKLLKTKGFIRYNEEAFERDYGIKPIRMIDLKALMGDPSDNVPGVKGIGEKTALKLLQEYDTIENLFDNIDKVKGAIHDKLLSGKESAFFSKEICTIYLDVPLGVDLEDMIYTGPTDKLQEIYEDLEFYSLLKNINKPKDKIYESNYKVLEDVTQINKENNVVSYYIECDNENYHIANILGMGLYDGNSLFFIRKDKIKEVMEYLKEKPKYTYDLKKNIQLLKDYNTNTVFDNMVATYLLNYQIKDDLAYIMNNEEIYVPFYNDILKSEEYLQIGVTLKAKYIYDTKEDLINKLKMENMLDLFENIETPLIPVLARMEEAGIKCDREVLKELRIENETKLKEVEKKILEYAGEDFNVGSTKQLGEVLFEHMNLPYPYKIVPGKRYHTDVSTLEKIVDVHPIIECILEYRNLAKLSSTYLVGLENVIMPDGKIHTIYKQTLTRTGRLSSIEPNMQNVPTRDENGKRVRKAFLPSNDILLSADYSQIELRVLAHISKCEELILAFKKGEDIHTQVASDIFEISKSEVTPAMRRTAKAVIFGIVYGISGFGLGNNLHLSAKDAKKFIDKYFQNYPGVKEYMDNTVKEAKMLGSVRTLFNRKRIIDELSNKNYIIRSSGERIAMNTPIQGTSADIIKMAMVKIDEELIKGGFKSKMLLQVHDELIFDVALDEKEKLESLVVNIMENIVKLSVPLKVNIASGKTWYDAK